MDIVYAAWMGLFQPVAPMHQMGLHVGVIIVVLVGYVMEVVIQVKLLIVLKQIKMELAVQVVLVVQVIMVLN